jgi:carboxypeptidase Q
VKDHFGGRPGPIGQFGGGGGGLGGPQGPPPPMELKSASKNVSAYYNIDNGTGRIRGIYMQENPAVAPIFTEWMKPFHDLGMTTLTMRNTGGTDHLSFDGVGIPGFQFIQDEVEYDTRTHHSNMDVYERIQASEMMVNSTIEAAFIYLTAQRDDKLPRKPLPADTKWVEEAPAAAAPAETKKK